VGGMKNFKPVLFIDIGELGCFYTLRETYLHTAYIPGDGPMGNAAVNGVYQGSVVQEVRSFHHFNLSTDADEAFAKAVASAAELEVPLEPKSADEIRAKMNEIMRATADQMAAREAARLAREADWTEMRAAREADDLLNIEAGVVSFGAKGRNGPRKLEDMDQGYLAWMVGMELEFEAGSKMRRLAEVIRTKFAHLLPRKPDLVKFAGTPGKRQVFQVEVLRVIKLLQPAYGAPWRNETVFIVTMITDDGACLVSKGTSFYATQGKFLAIKATVKCHDWYGDQAQTVVQRIAVLEEKAEAA
jgi:hypothetical protein